MVIFKNRSLKTRENVHVRWGLETVHRKTKKTQSTLYHGGFCYFCLYPALTLHDVDTEMTNVILTFADRHEVVP
jgi:hypothetical protein